MKSEVTMKPFSNIALLASVMACAITDSTGKHYPQVINVYDRCNETIIVKGDVRIKLTPIKYLSPYTQCSITFYTSYSEELTGRFLSYSMNPAYVHESGVCPYESIQLYDAAVTPQLSKEDDYCKLGRPKNIYYLFYSGRFRFNIGRFNHTLTAKVDLLISEVNPKADFNKSICPSGDFDCENRYCVSKDITCNGYDDCGNDVDETKGCGPFNKSPLTVAALVIFSLGGVTVFASLICIHIFLSQLLKQRGLYKPF